MAYSISNKEINTRDMKTYSYGKQTINKDDIKTVVKTLKSDFLTQGPKVKEFEDKITRYTGAKYAVVVSNGTAALHLAILTLNINSNHEGITTPITFVASANCLRYVGASVKFADIEPETALIDPKEIIKKITNKTKVIIPVHYAGQSCNMQTISKIAKKNNLYIVEDAAHALGSEYKGYKVGSCQYSDITTFSFHPVKTITTGEGGAITTNNKKLYEKLLQLRTHGIVRKPEITPWHYEMQTLGFNYRLPDLLATLGISQMDRLNNFIKRRQEIVKVYRKAFKNDERFTILKEMSNSKAVFHLFPLLLNFDKLKMNKKEIFNKLSEKGVRLQVHYIPIHLHPYYKELGFKKGDFPIAENYYKKEVSIPLYPLLKKEEVLQIIEIIKKNIK